MNGKCIFRGKKFFAPALFAAAVLAAIFLFFGCSSGGDDGTGEIPSVGASQDGVQKPGEGGNQGGGNKGDEQTPGEEEVLPPLECLCEITYVSMPNDSISPKRVSEILGALAFDYTMTNLSTGDFYQGNYVFYGDLPEKIKNEIRFMEVTEAGGAERNREYEFPETQKEVSFEILHGGKAQFEKTVKNGNYDRGNVLEMVANLLKEIIGTTEYETISGKLSSGNITLTAQTIKAVGDNFSVLESDAKNGSAQESTKTVVKSNKEAFVAQAEGEIIVSNQYGQYIITYKKPFKFSKEFNLDEIDIIKANGAKGDFTDATLTNTNAIITIDKVNEIRGTSLPTLNLNISLSEDFINGTEVYNLYKAYSKNLEDLKKVELTGDLSANQINGKTMSNNPDKYTLFTDDDKAKSSKDDSVKSLDVNALAKMSNQLKVYIISPNFEF